MRAIDPARVEELIHERPEGPLVSLVLPTHRTGKEIRQDPIRLKNLLNEAEDQVRAGPWDRADPAPLLAAARDLLPEQDFWNHQLDSLALYLGPGGMRTFRLPVRHDELCLAADHFHVKPLLPLSGEEDRFLVLALSQGRVRLFKANRVQIEELDLGPIPASLEDALGRETDQPSLQYRTQVSGAPAAGRGAAAFHGHGKGDDDREVDRDRFLEAVERGLRERLSDRRRPLVLAAVEELAARFRQISRYPTITPETLEGNPDRLEGEALHRGAWPIVAPLFAAPFRRDLERFAQADGTGLASADLEQIATAVGIGRVETLFVAADRQRWGRLAEEGRLELPGERRPGDGDVLDRLAVRALASGARVYARPAAELPGGRVAAAIFRY